MPEITPRVGLKKPLSNEHVNRASYNENLQIIEDNVALDSDLQNISLSLTNKVDKVTGKKLSTEDYTTADKNKLAAIEDGATNLKLGETSQTAYRGDRGKIAYDHSRQPHAPSNAQKNSDITKPEIEAKLTGDITSHSHTVTKSDVQLGNLQNYGIASQAQAQAGTSNSVYMTALRTKQAIDNNNVPTRIHDGELQYYDGGEWKSVGKSVIGMTPKQINYHSTGNTLSTSASGLTIFSANGKGVLSDFEAWFMAGGGSGQELSEIGLIVEIDGVNHLLYQDGYDGANTLYRIAYVGGHILTRSTSTENRSRNVIKSHIQYGFSSSFKIKVRSKRSQSLMMISLTGGYYLE